MSNGTTVSATIRRQKCANHRNSGSPCSISTVILSNRLPTLSQRPADARAVRQPTGIDLQIQTITLSDPDFCCHQCPHNIFASRDTFSEFNVAAASMSKATTMAHNARYADKLPAEANPVDELACGDAVNVDSTSATFAPQQAAPLTNWLVMLP